MGCHVDGNGDKALIWERRAWPRDRATSVDTPGDCFLDRILPLVQGICFIHTWGVATWNVAVRDNELVRTCLPQIGRVVETHHVAILPTQLHHDYVVLQDADPLDLDRHRVAFLEGDFWGRDDGRSCEDGGHVGYDGVPLEPVGQVFAGSGHGGS